ncbi:sigma 54-interacting transcriptional regulator [Spongiibacter marinus]|uniref:sigma-54 interaction domain-containing protein n=1 Tax=Spongiibacter marinus TaxID=354246 RepID=UPI00195F4CD9|nr:sigma 54-interacting transcriptional regulator [Spongiibacter marinus]MBM7422400.1 PAS domain S-box-containing protein [Spongiibacter marinus]
MDKLELALLQPVLDTLQDGVYITDENGLTLTINRAYERITGIQRHKVVGKHMTELVKAGYISKSVSLEVIREQEPVTLVQTIHDSRKIVVSGNPMFNEQGELQYVITNVRDITELLNAKHAQEQLEQIINTRQEYSLKAPDTALDSSIILSNRSQACYELAERIAPTLVKVLIQGETGTGKTLLAQFIHQHSERSDGPFISLNCAAMPEGLIEAELFGYVAGAFTGASNRGKDGLLDIAHGGTLFLDEIGDLPLALQAKLLKVVEENRFLPLGATRFKDTNIRLITATHHDLKEAVARGRFREDLYYRLCVVPITLPPLRQRKDEIIPLLNHYLQFFAEQYQVTKQLDPEAVERLINYSWPGNVRELMNLTERLLLSATGETIGPNDLPAEVQPTLQPGEPGIAGTLKEQVAALEKRLITTALQQHRTTRAAAASLGIDQSTLVKKSQRWKTDVNQ